jgi:hypothetical protein
MGAAAMNSPSPYGRAPAVASGGNTPASPVTAAGTLSGVDIVSENEAPLVLAEMTVTQLVMAISDLHKIANEQPTLLDNEYPDLALASHRLSRVVQKLEAGKKEAAE